MKKTISLLLAVLLFITAAGCSKRGEAAETPAPTEDAVPTAEADPDALAHAGAHADPDAGAEVPQSL